MIIYEYLICHIQVYNHVIPVPYLWKINNNNYYYFLTKKKNIFVCYPSATYNHNL